MRRSLRSSDEFPRTMEDLPVDLKDLVLAYNSARERSRQCWSNTSGSISDNAARVRASDSLAEEAMDAQKEVETYCRLKGINYPAVERLME